MTRLPTLLVTLVLAAGCALPTGCASGSSDDAKTASPRSDAGLRPERGFRKKPTVAATPEQEAVFAFLDEDKQRFQAATTPLPPDAKPTAVTAALTKYLDQFTKADTSALPPAFKSPLDKYQRSVRGLATALGRLPDGSFEGTTLYDGLAGLFRGENDKGKPLGGDVVKAVAEVRTASAAVYDAAAPFGIDVDR